jgi:hypothetical protein
MPEGNGASSDGGFPRALDLALREGKRLNPMWLHGRVGGGRALHVRVPGLDLSAPLGAHYDTVEDLACGPGGRLEETLPFADATFDAVTAYGCVPGRATLGEPDAQRRQVAVLVLARQAGPIPRDDQKGRGA